MALQHLRSSTANKRPDPAAMAEGQLALNTANASPGLFYKDATGLLIKAGPVHIGATAPNASPAVGGHAGNSVGEAWLDTSGTNPLLKIWNGSVFQTVQPVASGTVVSTADTGSVTSTMILDGTIVNADINASAAIADTKLATIATALKVSNSATTAASANTASAIVARDASGNFTAGTITAALTGAASSNVLKAGDTMTGALVVPLASAATPSLTFTGDLNTGVFSPGADQVAISTNGTSRIVVDASGNVNIDSNTFYVDAANNRVGLGTSSPSQILHVAGASAQALVAADSGTGTIRITRGSVALEVGATTTVSYMGSSSSTDVSLRTGGTERARIDTSGRLLVGTSTSVSVATLEANQQIFGSAPQLSIIRGSNNASGATLALAKSRNTAIGSRTIVSDGDTMGSIRFCGDDGVNLDAIGAQIAGQVDGSPGAGDLPSRLVFSTTADGAASPTERLRITSAGVLQVADAGNITVGTTTGTKIGTATTEKLGFYNATPVVQPTAVADATTAIDVITQLNALLAKLRTLGIIAT
jgi:hypothetical protein